MSDADEYESGSGSEQSSDDEAGTSSSGSDDELSLEQQVANVPLELLEQLKADGRGLTGAAAKQAAKEASKSKFKRPSKHAPQEVTSKRPVSRFREVIQIPNSNRHFDPRFDASVAALDKGKFAKQYKFLYEEVLPQEKRALKDRLARERSEPKRQAIQLQLQRLESQMNEQRQLGKREQLQKEVKAQQKAAVSEGKGPFYLRKSELRKRELLQRYEELKKAGKLDKYMEKRRRKNAAKDHRYLPSQRRGAAGAGAGPAAQGS